VNGRLAAACLVVQVTACGHPPEERPASNPGALVLPGWAAPRSDADGGQADDERFIPTPSREARTVGADPLRPPIGSSTKKIDLDIKNADVRDVLRLIADVGNVNIVAGAGVSGAMTIRLEQVAWIDALRAVLAAHHLVAETSGNVIIVEPSPTR
jgi:hypothetical protein